MAPKGKRGGKRGGVKGRWAKRPAPRKRGGDTKDFASLQVTQKTFPVGANTMYALRNFSLSNNVRAGSVAQGYQFYRIRNVTCKFIPYFDTFPGGTSINLGVPQLYYMIDKTGSIPPNSDLNTLKFMGAKPHRFDDKNISCTWKPAVVNLASDNGSGTTPNVSYAGSYRVSPWLPTNANATNSSANFVINSVDHRGLTFFIQAQNWNNNQVGEMEVTITYDFKKPLWISPSTAGEVTLIDVDELGKDTPPPEVYE